MSHSSRKRGTIKILTLYCGHSARRIDQYPPFGVMCPHCGTRQAVLRWTDTGRLRRRGSAW